MKKSLLFSLAALSLAGCATAPQRGSGSYSLATVVGKPVRIAAPASLNSDCTTIGPAVIQILAAPQNGRAIVSQGNAYPQFPLANPRSKCNIRSLPATLLFYHPNPGFAGSDMVTYRIIYATGTETVYTATVNVR